MYCSSMWFDSTVASMKKLKIAYNNGLRRLLNLPKYSSASEMFVNLNISSFNELLRKFVFSFKTRIIESDNSLVNGIVTSTISLFSSIWAWWSDILTLTHRLIIIIFCVETITAYRRLILTYFIIVICVCECV